MAPQDSPPRGRILVMMVEATGTQKGMRRAYCVPTEFAPSVTCDANTALSP